MSVNLGKLFFYFYGYFAEKLDFIDENGQRNLMLRYDYLGGSVTISVTPDEYANAPEEGTLVFVVGLVRSDKSKGRITLRPSEILVEGRDKDFKQPTQDQLLAGPRFQGDVFMSNRVAALYDGDIYRSATIQTFGNTIKFSNLDERMYSLWPEQPSFVSIDGKLDTKIVNYESKDDKRNYKRCEIGLLLEKVVKINAQAETAKPSKTSAA